MILDLIASSNRTFMELKSFKRIGVDASPHRSNRTFMELKFIYQIYHPHHHQSSNRTFMELKLISRYIVMLAFFVLIAPLWN